MAEGTTPRLQEALDLEPEILGQGLTDQAKPASRDRAVRWSWLARREGLLRGSLYYWSFRLSGQPGHRLEYYLRLWRLCS